MWLEPSSFEHDHAIQEVVVNPCGWVVLEKNVYNPRRLVLSIVDARTGASDRLTRTPESGVPDGSTTRPPIQSFGPRSSTGGASGGGGESHVGAS